MNAPPASTSRVVGTAELSGPGVAMIATPYSTSSLDFIRALPNSRWEKAKSRWRCDATPLSAWQMRNAGLSLCDRLKAIADHWDQAMLPPTIGQILPLLTTFKTTPWKHQQRAMAFCVAKPASMLALQMGTGKSLTTICLLQAWQSRRVLILCPKSVLGVWRREFFKHCAVSHQVTVLEDGTSKHKAKQAELAILRSSAFAISAVVVNYESAWREDLAKVLANQQWDAVVCDESHRIKDPGTNAGKFVCSLTPMSKKRLCLTGTPMGNGAIDLFGQYKFLEPAIFGTSVTRFKNQFCETHPQFKGMVVRYKNQDELNRRYSAIAFRVESKDVLDLPECNHITIPVALNSTTREYYETMKKQCLLEVASGEITAANGAVKLMRLHQIACGHATTESGEVIRLGTDKQDALLDLLADMPTSEPVVVFCRFREDLRQIQEVAVKLKRRYGELSGNRRDITPHSTMREDVDLMGVQMKSGGVGIDLTRARYMVWFSTDFNYVDYEQANARVHRPGQDRTTFIYHLAAINTVDVRIYQALRNKKDAIELVLEALKDNVVEE